MMVIARILMWCCVGFPGPPEDLKWIDVATNSCKLTWNAPEYHGSSPVTGYNVERHNGSSWDRVNTTTKPGCFIVSARISDVFRVRAVNESGEGPPSVSVTGRGVSVSLYVSSGQNSLTAGRIAAAHGRFSVIRQVTCILGPIRVRIPNSTRAQQ